MKKLLMNISVGAITPVFEHIGDGQEDPVFLVDINQIRLNKEELTVLLSLLRDHKAVVEVTERG